MSIENSVQLIGNLGDDPKVTYTQGGMAVCRASLATTQRRKDKDGNKKEETSWHRIVFFGSLAEIAGEYLRKGSKIAVAGMIRYGKYDKDGVTHYTTDIACDQMKMLDGRGEGQQQRQSGGYGQQPRGGRNEGRPASGSPPPMDDFEDADIPF
ncbi:single-stranded DNA-binding protein [Xanthomonas citri pv. citri]